MKNKAVTKKQFGLPTAISMIVGIVIGSGIFFKTDDILISTNGNVLLGVVALGIGALGIIFGGLTFSQLAKETDKAGGIITYAELAYNRLFAFIIGFFQLTTYYPALIAVILFVAANYTLILFPYLPINIWVLTLIYYIVIFGVNYISSKLTGIVQTGSSIIKIIPLVLIGFVGVFFGNPKTMNIAEFSIPLIFSSSAAVVSAAFSYDGWPIATSISHEIKNAKRNMSIALCIAPLVVMLVYLIYFVVMSSILGPERIIELGDAHVSEVASMYFGTLGNKLIMTTIIISVLGTVNGLVFGGSRVPYSLALRNELPYSNRLAEVNKTSNVPRRSLFVTATTTLFWLAVHCATMYVPILNNLDVSSIPIVLMNGFYISIYVGVIKKYINKNIKSTFFGFIFPILATLGGSFVIYGGLTSPMFLIYLLISISIIIISVIIYRNEGYEVNK